MTANKWELNALGKKRARLEALGYVLNKTNRVLTSRDVAISIEDKAGGGISWTDGTTVFINAAQVDTPTTPEAIVRLLGINYHEVCHILYTPRVDSEVRTACIRDGYAHAFNMLEDMRIEGFFVAKYPKAAFYFTEMVLRHLADPQTASRQYPLIYGRKYLPAKVRDAFDQASSLNEDQKIALRSVIDRYRRHVYVTAKDHVDGYNMVVEYQDIITNFMPLDQRPPDIGCVGIGDSADGLDKDEASVPDQIRGQEDVDDGIDEEVGASQDTDADDDDTEETEEEGTGSGEGDADGDSDDDDGEETGGGEGDSDGDEDGEETGPADTDASGGGEGGPVEIPSDFNDIMQDAIDNAVNQDEVVDDVSGIQKTTRDGHVLEPHQMPDWPYAEVPVPSQDLLTSRKVLKELQQLRQEFDPLWEYEQPRGLLDTKAAMSPTADRKHIWREWQDGNDDATDIECVILADFSGSMRRSFDDVSRGLWVMRRALDKIGASTLVMIFGNGVGMGYKRSDKVKGGTYRQFLAMGGTQPIEGIRAARDLFLTSKRVHKLLVVMTDGGFTVEKVDAETLIAEMGQNNVMTAMFWYGLEVQYAYGAKMVLSVDTEQQFVDAVKALVKGAMKEAKR